MGTVTITITGKGNFTDSTTVTFQIVKANPVVSSWPTAAGIPYGAALSTSALTGGDISNGSFAWTTPETIPTVTNNGYSVTFTPTDADNYNTATYTVSIVVAAKDITSDSNITITAVKAAGSIDVFVYDGETQLGLGTDYSLEFLDENDDTTTDPEEATKVVITGTGNYSGEQTVDITEQQRRARSIIKSNMGMPPTLQILNKKR